MTLHKAVPSGDSNGSASAFGMPQALVILGFLSAAVVLRLVTPIAVRDIVVLLSAAGGTSVAVLLAAGFNSRRGGQGLLRRLISAALTSGSGN
ncbi:MULTISPECIES: hypothetical protein [Streptomyces]|uniref:Uncharacterized protein n=1 Tax=Streptomyces sviceus (strain ATCC 29083 / DSM 924 / JCM 4929 / NBRC 13980 / NCIMB 11184 / NRRL 5439 / UC 5370) TaxID=463191 RepID=B5I4D7_STRX2|nr:MULTISPECIES: hypothetical protein [Streptomyces]EDY59942.1 conserved hypothetical protein [Streptomyces sviceus ATCC 29083]MYT03254.1 hypothetical protein [Streptomyces sp. SID5470]